MYRILFIYLYISLYQVKSLPDQQQMSLLHDHVSTVQSLAINGVIMQPSQQSIDHVSLSTANMATNVSTPGIPPVPQTSQAQGGPLVNTNQNGTSSIPSVSGVSDTKTSVQRNVNSFGQAMQWVNLLQQFTGKGAIQIIPYPMQNNAGKAVISNNSSASSSHTTSNSTSRSNSTRQAHVLNATAASIISANSGGVANAQNKDSFNLQEYYQRFPMRHLVPNSAATNIAASNNSTGDGAKQTYIQWLREQEERNKTPKGKISIEQYDLLTNRLLYRYQSHKEASLALGQMDNYIAQNIFGKGSYVKRFKCLFAWREVHVNSNIVFGHNTTTSASSTSSSLVSSYGISDEYSNTEYMIPYMKTYYDKDILKDHVPSWTSYVENENIVNNRNNYRHLVMNDVCKSVEVNSHL